MFRKQLFLIATIVFVLTVISSSMAHPGRTDANGGHYNRKTGEYHYHNGGGGSSGSSRSSNRNKNTPVATPKVTVKPTQNHTYLSTPRPKSNNSLSFVPDAFSSSNEWDNTSTFVLPSDDLWGLPMESIEKTLGGRCDTVKVGKKDALVVRNVKVNSLNMDCYYIFGAKMEKYNGLSKITYVHPVNTSLTKAEREKALDEAVKKVSKEAGKPKSKNKTTAKWAKNKYTITVGTGKFEHYIGTKRKTVGIVLEWNGK